jgi:hypothetical protein
MQYSGEATTAVCLNEMFQFGCLTAAEGLKPDNVFSKIGRSLDMFFGDGKVGNCFDSDMPD